MPGVARQRPPERVQDLIEAATQVFLEKGYRRTQMADVAARLGVAKGTVYLYAESKEALFDAVLRHADPEAPPDPPASLPLPTPPPGATLALVDARARGRGLPSLDRALSRRRVGDVGRELDEILRELYGLLARHRIAIKLMDRSAQDLPALAAVWYKSGREAMLGLLGRYLADRTRRGRLRAFPDAAVAARIVLETLVYWAVHIHWDASPQRMDAQAAEDTVVAFVTAALLGNGAPDPGRPRKRPRSR
jgi:AcrR family transcriptional regulator